MKFLCAYRMVPDETPSNLGLCCLPLSHKDAKLVSFIDILHNALIMPFCKYVVAKVILASCSVN